MSVLPIAGTGGAVQTRLHRVLLEHHRALETACEALLANTYGDDPRNLVFAYRSFERSMLEHLAAEDELILPAYAESAAADAQWIRDDHVAIRELLFQIGVDVELHIVRVETVKRLIEKLQAHAVREDAAMYPWAQAHLPLTTRRWLFVRIGRALRALLGQRSAAAS